MPRRRRRSNTLTCRRDPGSRQPTAALNLLPTPWGGSRALSSRSLLLRMAPLASRCVHIGGRNALLALTPAAPCSSADWVATLVVLLAWVRPMPRGCWFRRRGRRFHAQALSGGRADRLANAMRPRSAAAKVSEKSERIAPVIEAIALRFRVSRIACRPARILASARVWMESIWAGAKVVGAGADSVGGDVEERCNGSTLAVWPSTATDGRPPIIAWHHPARAWQARAPC